MAYVYLMKLHGMHKIGRTDFFDQRMKQLEPAKLVAKRRTNRSRDLEAELHRHFARWRLPQSEWFALSPTQVNECLQMMGLKYDKWSKYGTRGGPRRAKRAAPEELAEYRRLAAEVSL